MSAPAVQRRQLGLRQAQPGWGRGPVANLHKPPLILSLPKDASITVRP